MKRHLKSANCALFRTSLSCLLLALASPGGHAASAIPSSPAARCDAVVVKGPSTRITKVADGLVHPWGLAFLPDGRMLVTEKPGRIRIVDAEGHLSRALHGVPAVHDVGQGGLLDVVLDPAYASNHQIYFAYAEDGGEGSGTAVAKAVLDPEALSLNAVTVIYRQTPKVSGNGQYGVRLVFANDGTLFIAMGERQKFTPAQDPMQSLGKIVRIRTDGSIPPDNPFAKQTGWLPEIWSLGHRNPQGMTRHPVTGRMWTAEHGAKGGDEINEPEAGRNYGWPVISYGVNYDGSKIGEGTAKPGLEQPLCYWDPSIAPGNLVFYTGGKVKEWAGNLFVTALKDESLMRLTLDGTHITGQERISIGKRVRDVRVGPDGWLYLLTDESDGEILRVSH